MKLQHFQTRGISGLRDVTISLAGRDQPSSLLAIKGPPGSGKSRLLKLLVHCKERLGAYGPVEPDKLFASEQKPAKVTLDWWLDPEEQQRSGAPRQVIPSEVSLPAARGLQLPLDPALVDLLTHFDVGPEHAKVDHFPIERAAGQRATTAGDARAEQKRLRLSSATQKFASLKQLANQEFTARSKRSQLLVELYREVTGHTLTLNQSLGLQVRKRDGEHRALAELSASEWDAFVVTASIVLLGLQRSLILYDSPELHLPHDEAARRFALYRRAAPQAQWLVATNCETILREAPVTLDLGAANHG